VDARDYPAIAAGYAEDVTKGRIPAGEIVKLACKRHLAELKRQKRKDFPHRFDPEKAARPCRFIERLPHSKGRWAAKKEKLRLEPWQIFIICCVFGWLRKVDGLRRYRVLFVVVPRKNGKSQLTAGIGLYMLCADGEHGAEVYSGATNEKQAWEVFGPARLMADRTPALKARFGVDVNAKTINILADGSKFETLIGKPGDGQSPSCSIHDEYHEHPDDDQVDTMQTGMGAREQPLQVLITTAGDNLAGPCYARIQDERKKLKGIGRASGATVDDDVFFIEYALDKNDDWQSEDSLRKANPNYDVSVGGDFLRARLRDAVATPRKRGVFKTKHLNLWVSARAAYFDIEAWRRCHDANMPVRAVEALQLEELRGRRCILGLDLASKVDIAALEYLFLPLGETATVDDPYIRIGRYFLPSEQVQSVASYQEYDAEGLLDVTDGNIIDYEEIEAAIVEATSMFQVEWCAYDPFQATMLVTRLERQGVPVVEYRPVVLNFSEPMKELDALTRSRRFRHSGCRVMEWQMGNVVAKADAKDNVYPRKPEGQDHQKIDNPVALMSALGVAMAKASPERSFWETEAA
jgi:phage terminase large subunit-like protein